MNCPLCPKHKPQFPEFGTLVINGVKVPVLLSNPDNTPCEEHAMDVWENNVASLIRLPDSLLQKSRDQRAALLVTRNGNSI